LDSARFKAESEWQFKLYFELVKSKIDEYSVLPSNTYNVDEKGFLIGFITKAKRIFSREVYERKKKIHNTQDGNREWITTIAYIYANRTAILPALIYQAVTGNLQDS
jgi:hypothetical protein